MSQQTLLDGDDLVVQISLLGVVYFSHVLIITWIMSWVGFGYHGYVSSSGSSSGILDLANETPL